MEQPKGDKLQRAIKWISSRMADNETRPGPKLMEDASREFNLSPNEQEFLLSFYRKQG